MKHIAVILLTLLMFACEKPDIQLSHAIATELERSGWNEVNLSELATFEWERMCIIGPYLLQENQDEILGFHTQSLISGNDGVSTLVFIKSNKVVRYVNHPRDKGDFLSSGQACYKRIEAVFIKDPSRPGEWVYLIGKKNV